MMGYLMLGVIVASAVVATAADMLPTGASAVFTSDQPVIVRVRGMIAGGRLSDAEALLEGSGLASDPNGAALLAEARDIIRRVRRDYGLAQEELTERLRQSIPDVTAADVERWRQAGQVQWRRLDGRVCCFRSEPSNLFRFCDEAKQQRDQHAAKASGRDEAEPASTPGPEQTLLAHLRDVIGEAEKTGDELVLPVRHRITYKLTVRPDRPGAKRGSRVRCWLPFPQEYRQQQDVELVGTVPEKHVLAPNAGGGRALGGAPQRTVYLQQDIEDPSQPVTFEERFEYVSYAYYPSLRDADARALPDDYDGRCLEERPPHIVFTPKLRQAVERVVGDEANPLARARRIFCFVSEEIRYCSEEEYSTIPSFSDKALTSGRGDCGVQGMLFITMCRAAGVPARWQSGWETRPDAWNMHDWAEFYVEPWGWLPADVSYGLKASPDPRVREFYLGHEDAYRMIVSLDYGAPLHPPKTSLRSEPADFQRGEVEIDGRNLYFDEWTWDFQFEAEPMEGGASTRRTDDASDG